MFTDERRGASVSFSAAVPVITARIAIASKAHPITPYGTSFPIGGAYRAGRQGGKRGSLAGFGTLEHYPTIWNLRGFPRG